MNAANRATPATEKRKTEVTHILSVLHKWGVHTLGELASLDRDQLGARLGSEAVRLWERASGKSTRLLNLVRPPEVFEEIIEFEHEIETAEPLLFILRRFLEQLTLRLSALYLLAKELTLQINFANKAHYAHRFQIPDTTNDIEILFRVLHTHLEDFKSEHPVIGLSLKAQASKASRQQFGLFETALRDPARLPKSLTRLIGLLGADRVGTPVLEDSHQPDAFRIEPFAWELREPPEKPIAMTGPALRRFRPASPASVRMTKNKLAQISARDLDDAVAAQQGPYFISGNWWDEKKWERAEWDLELQSGTVCRCQECTDGWQLEGVYD
jgi:protein ImuB